MNFQTKTLDASYFIKKFEAIPEEQWCIDSFVDEMGRRCAYGHCGVKNENYNTNQSRALKKMLSPLMVRSGSLLIKFKYSVSNINDGKCPDYQQPTPKQRILAALKDLKN